MVIDKRSGLQWQRCSVGQKWIGTTCEGEPVGLSLEDAKNYSKNYYWTSTQSADGQYTYMKEFRMGGLGATPLNGKSDCPSCDPKLILVRDAGAKVSVE